MEYYLCCPHLLSKTTTLPFIIAAQEYDNVAWDKETVVRAAETVGDAGTLWILFLAQNDEVGIEKTSNLQTLGSSVRSYAKEIGLDDPGQETINQGYNGITNSRVVDADGNVACINRDDKSNDLV